MNGSPAPYPLEDGSASAPVLEAVGIEKAYRRGLWPMRRVQPVLRGVDLALPTGSTC